MMAPPIQTTPHEDLMTDARKRMVDSQLRPNKVSDPRILDAMRRLPREQFLPAPLLARAYADDNVPLGGGRVLLQPMVLGRMVQAAMPLPGEKALVIGAGTGYSAAVLAATGCEVTALEENAVLAALAKSVLDRLAPGVTLVSGPLQAGWAANAPYDLILIDGAVPEVPGALGSQLNRETGRLLTIVIPGGVAPGGNSTRGHPGHAVQATPTPAGVSVRALFDCDCPVLPGFAPAPVFEF
jgi:protein-L-isoaspartate(D-aspartate) O-methyltransferase